MRSMLDRLVSWTGMLLAVVLLVAGGLLTWASTFIGDEVHSQLSEQHITMPSGDALTALPDADRAALEEYAGQQLTTGPQAQAYADHYIKVHMKEASGGQTYSEVSGQFIGQCTGDSADPTSADCQQLGQLRQTLFMGDTLRGLLLYGYAFATIGTIAGYAAWAAFLGALFVAFLALLGLRHARVSDAEARAGSRETVGA